MKHTRALAVFVCVTACGGQLVTGDSQNADGGVDAGSSTLPPACTPGETRGCGTCGGAMRCASNGEWSGTCDCPPQPPPPPPPPPPDPGSDGGPPLQHGKVIVAQASPDLFPVRLCFGTGVKDDGSDVRVAPLVALPHDGAEAQSQGHPFPGLFPGTAQALPNLTDLSKIAVTVFAVRATAITGDVKTNANERTCDQLLGMTGVGGGALSSSDFFKVATIPKGNFALGTTTIVALEGCLPNSTASAMKCGAGYTAANGSLVLTLWKVDRAISDPGKMGVQVVHMSSAWDAVFLAESGGSYTGASAAFTTADGGLASPPLPPAPGERRGALAPTTAYAQADLGARPSTTRLRVTALAGGGATFAKYEWPLDVVQQLSFGGGVDAGNMFSNGANYTFMLLGDPDPTTPQLLSDGGLNPSFDGHGAHVVAFSNDPALPKL